MITIGVNDNNRELTLSNNNVYIKPTVAIGLSLVISLEIPNHQWLTGCLYMAVVIEWW